jgi:hypothetical protein
VIVLDRVAVIGSSNLSDSSERRLVEAVWVTDDPTVIAEARSFVGRLAAQSRPIDRALLQRILSIKVARRLPTISNRRENLILDELRTDLDTTPPPAVDKELATQATPQPVVPVPPTPIQPKPPDPEIAGVLSRHVGRGGSTWVHDPQLVLMDRDEVGKLAGRLPVASIGQRVWARKADLGTPRQSDRSIPRPDYQILINALVALAEAKRAIPTEGEILDLVVARYKSGKYENKPSLELRKDPRRFYGQYFRAATEDSDSYGGKLKYLLHATPERAKVFIESLGVQTASR